MAGFRRDLELAPGAQFRLRRRLWPRVLSALGTLCGLAVGVADLILGYRFPGALMLLLSLAFGVQLLQAELDAFWFDGRAAVRRRLVLRELAVRETRLSARNIRGVQVEFVGRKARAWIETVRGEEVPLVEGEADEVERIADRLSAQLRLASQVPPGTQLQ